MRTLIASFLLIAFAPLSAKMIDLTHTLSEETLVYPGKLPFSRVICANYEAGYRLDNMALGTGIGTHMDSPSHFFQSFEAIDAIPLDKCVGDACVLHLAHKVQEDVDYAVTAADILEWEALYGTIEEKAIVLIHTGWDRFWATTRFCEPDAVGICHFPGISKDAAELLLARNIAAVGIDTMGIDRGIDATFPAHNVLLGAKIPIVENMAELGQLPESGAKVSLFPMKIKDVPEAPVRAVASLRDGN